MGISRHVFKDLLLTDRRFPQWIDMTSHIDPKITSLEELTKRNYIEETNFGNFNTHNKAHYAIQSIELGDEELELLVGIEPLSLTKKSEQAIGLGTLTHETGKHLLKDKKLFKQAKDSSQQRYGTEDALHLHVQGLFLRKTFNKLFYQPFRHNIVISELLKKMDLDYLKILKPSFFQAPISRLQQLGFLAHNNIDKLVQGATVLPYYEFQQVYSQSPTEKLATYFPVFSNDINESIPYFIMKDDQTEHIYNFGIYLGHQRKKVHRVAPAFRTQRRKQIEHVEHANKDISRYFNTEIGTAFLDKQAGHHELHFIYQNTSEKKIPVKRLL